MTELARQPDCLVRVAAEELDGDWVVARRAVEGADLEDIAVVELRHAAGEADEFADPLAGVVDHDVRGAAARAGVV
jgi:hypothetical protein